MCSFPHKVRYIEGWRKKTVWQWVFWGYLLLVSAQAAPNKAQLAQMAWNILTQFFFVEVKVENLIKYSKLQFEMLSQSKVICLPLNLTAILPFEHWTLCLEIIIGIIICLFPSCSLPTLQQMHSSRIRLYREPICVPSSLEGLLTRQMYFLFAPVEIFSFFVSACFHEWVIKQMLSVSILPPQWGLLLLFAVAKW